MRRRPQDSTQRHVRTDRSDRGEGPPPAAAEPNSNLGAFIIHEAAEKSGIHDEENKIPPGTEGNQTETDSHLMLVDCTSKEADINGRNADISESENQGKDLYSVPITYDTPSTPFPPTAQVTSNTLWPRDTPSDEVPSMQPTNPQSQEKIVTTRKGLRKSEVAKKVGTYEVDKKLRQKRENRVWEDDDAPENTECKRARLEVKSTTTNPTVEADIQPCRWQ